MSHNQYPPPIHPPPMGPVPQDFEQQPVHHPSIGAPGALRISGTLPAQQAHHHTTYVPPPHATASSSAQLHQQQQVQRVSIHPMQPHEIVQQQVVIGGAGSPAQQQQPTVLSKNRQLQVDDALSYLEKVRRQFENEPQVYNDFLEVMKEFKSHTIDTNGVIRRVSGLFRTHPELIVGFNTFLPHGYEVRVHDNFIGIFEPNGVSSLINNSSGEPIPVQIAPSTPAPAAVRPVNISSQVQQVQHHVVHQQPQPANKQAMVDVVSVGLAPSNPSTTTTTCLNLPPQQQPHNVEQTLNMEAELHAGFVTYSQRSAAMMEVGVEQLPTANKQQQQHQVVQAQKTATSATGGQQQAQPISTTEAIGYLNRIKERFANRPDVYHEFLKILKHRDDDHQPKLSEADVYQAVSRLFQNEPDLMRDFKSFLPDAKLGCASDRQQLQHQLEVEEQELVAEQQQQLDKAQQQQHQQHAAKQNVKRQIGREHSNAGAKKARVQSTNKVAYEKSIPEVMEVIKLKDFAIFEKIHHALKSETIFMNFLRCLMLYTKSVVSRNELTELITPFLAGSPELLKEFKDILLGNTPIGYELKKQRPLEDRISHDIAAQIDYNTCKQHGVSYRCLPDEFARPICSGRTELCSELLNDTYVSYPTWSSEDSSAVSSKKSPYEEMMYRTEDERFEVDIYIEVNSAAIIALEGANRKMESMSAEEAKQFVADQNNLGCSATFVTRAIKKLYGEHSSKILAALKENPRLTVPLVLKRLREKDAESRKLRKEFNVIWREQVEKNYLKSLDHQALTFKANDVKDIRSKSFIQQLENIYNERIQKEEQEGQAIVQQHKPDVFIDYPEDKQVFQDANELLLHYIKRQNAMTKKEQGRIRDLLNAILPKLFQLQLELVDNEQEAENSSERSEGETELANSKDGGKKAKEPVVAEPHQKPTNGKPKRNGGGGMGKNGNNGSLVASSSSHQTVNKQHPPLLSDAVLQLDYVLFFGTNYWILFIRLHAIMCDRLAMIKKRTDELCEEYAAELRVREEQERVYAKYGDSAEALPMNAVDIHHGLRELKKPLQNPENFYQIMLQEMKNLLDGQIEGPTFEDTLRSMFDTKAYVLFTMDKLVSTLVRQLQNFVGDSASMACIEQFNAYYTKRTATGNKFEECGKADREYFEAMEKVLLNQHCFKMYFISSRCARPIVTIELIDTEESEDEQSVEEEENVVESEKVIGLPSYEDHLSKIECDFNLSLNNEAERSSTFCHRNLRHRRRLAKFAQQQNANNNNNVKSDEANNTAASGAKIPRFFFSNSFWKVLKANGLPIEVLGKNDVPDYFYWDVCVPSQDNTATTMDVIVRKGAREVDRKTFRKMANTRAKRFNNWLEMFHKDDHELSARWLTTGCTSRPCHHSEFKFLRFNVYSSSEKR